LRFGGGDISVVWSGDISVNLGWTASVYDELILRLLKLECNISVLFWVLVGISLLFGGGVEIGLLIGVKCICFEQCVDICID
jgi:hypothetical protein